MLHGEKLRGRWTLVQIRGRERRDAGKAWLLIKGRDETARASADYDVTAALPESVATGRALDQIAARARPRVALEQAREGSGRTPERASEAWRVGVERRAR